MAESKKHRSRASKNALAKLYAEHLGQFDPFHRQRPKNHSIEYMFKGQRFTMRLDDHEPDERRPQPW